MSLLADARGVLIAQSTVTAIVGASANSRIWNSWSRTNVVPCIVIDIDSDEEQNGLDGRGVGNIATMTVTCRDATYDGAKALQLAVKSVLAGYSGVFEAVLNDTVKTETPKNNGSTDQWYDQIMEFTMLY